MKRMTVRLISLCVAVQMIMLPLNAAVLYGRRTVVTVREYVGMQSLYEENREEPNHNIVTYDVDLTYIYDQMTGEIVDAAAPEIVYIDFDQDFGTLGILWELERWSYWIAEDKQSITFTIEVIVVDPITVEIPFDELEIWDLNLEWEYVYHFTNSWTLYLEEM